MADRTRNEKLAAAKKKLQQFNKKKKGTDNNQNISIDETQTNISEKTIRNINNGHHSRNSSENISFKGDSSHESHNNLSSEVQSVKSKHESSQSNAESSSKETENLLQLCQHINGILDRDSSEEQSPTAIIQELQKRNYDLAEIMKRKETVMHQVTSQLEDLKAQNERLSTLAQDQNISQETLNKLKIELVTWQQQCDAQNITISALTSEKSSLQSTLAEYKQLVQSKIQENEDLSAKLKASRERVGDLEKKAQLSKSSGEVGEHARKQMALEADRLRSELSAIKSSRDELFQVNGELKSRLSAIRQDKATLELTVDDLKKQLELSQVYVQQLTNQNQSESQDELERLQQLEYENKAYQTRLNEYSTALDNVTQERDRLTKQYRSYLEQLEKSISDLKMQIEALAKERDEARDNIISLKKQLEKKEKQIQAAAEHQKESTMSPSQDRTRQLIASYEKEMEELRHENASFRERIDAQLRDHSQLSQACEEKDARCLELENTVARYEEERVDKNKILSEIQSDKTALSRALAQNRQLKMQLTELQEAFVKLSNDNMDLLSDYQHEQHVAKELAARLSQQEDELKEIRQLLTRKDEELRTLRQNYHNVTEEMFADVNDEEDDDDADVSQSSYTEKKLSFKKPRQRQLSDVKHQRHLAEKLQKELTAAQLAINKLTNQNNELRTRLHQINSSKNINEEEMLSTLVQFPNNSEVPTPSVETNSTEGQAGISGDTVASLLASVSQLEAERDQLLLEVEAVRQSQLQHASTNLTEQKDVVPLKTYLDLKETMSLLEERLKASLECQAELQDTNAQLEHSIGQLECETDTIGEYILLYQEQRSRLKEKTLAREQYIQRLSNERESLTSKLKQLQELVIQLMAQRADSLPVNSTKYHTESFNDKNSKKVTSTPLSKKNIEENKNGNWSDSEESVVEAFVPMLMNENGDIDSDSQSPSHSVQPAESATIDNEMTRRILRLLNEMKESPLVDANASLSPINLVNSSLLGPDHCILCKCCTGVLIDV